MKAIRGGFDVAVVLRDLGAQTFEALDVKIDGTGADGASAGQRNAGVTAAREERPEDECRSAHGLDQLIRRFGSGQRARADRGAMMGASVAEFDFGAHGGKQLARRLDVSHLRDVFQNHRFVGK